MANEGNLMPMTREKQVRGGRSRSLTKKLINRQFCNRKCPIYNQCRYKHISKARHLKEVKDAMEAGVSDKIIKKMKPRCLLKTISSTQQERILRFTLEGEEGINKDLIDSVSKLSELIMKKPKPGDIKSYLYEVRELKKAIYGERKKIESKIEGKLTAELFATAYKQMCEENGDTASSKQSN